MTRFLSGARWGFGSSSSSLPAAEASAAAACASPASAPSFSNKDLMPYGLDEYMRFFFAELPNAKISFPVGIIQTFGFFLTET